MSRPHYAATRHSTASPLIRETSSHSTRHGGITRRHALRTSSRCKRRYLYLELLIADDWQPPHALLSRYKEVDLHVYAGHALFSVCADPKYQYGSIPSCLCISSPSRSTPSYQVVQCTQQQAAALCSPASCRAHTSLMSLHNASCDALPLNLTSIGTQRSPLLTCTLQLLVLGLMWSPGSARHGLIDTDRRGPA